MDYVGAYKMMAHEAGRLTHTLRYDVDRTVALIPDEERDPNVPVKGFMSHKTKIYLADVVS
jgi:hypothetical protein